MVGHLHGSEDHAELLSVPSPVENVQNNVVLNILISAFGLITLTLVKYWFLFFYEWDNF